MKYSVSIIFLLLAGAAPLHAEPPRLGAQVWIEPGQTSQEIDGWFAQLEAAHMPVARIFVMWPYLQPAAEKWDFSLYDATFRAAEAHHVRIVATLTANGLPLFLGGDGSQGGGVVRSPALKAASDDYIRRVVRRYRSSAALDSWLLMNEPGEPPAAAPLAVEAFRPWLANRYPSIAALNLAWGTDYRSFQDVEAGRRKFWNRTSTIDWMMFWRTFQTTQLREMADFVRAEDRQHGIHLNPAGLVSNLAGVSDNLPEWRGFLDTLGCSIHPAWHFGLLKEERFALGVSYINDLVAGSIEPKPYWVTELQGGNNISSSTRPMNPTPADIAQWTWTSIGSGARRVIFWLLNARREGVEAAEWSLLTFQQRPSNRLETASRIAGAIERSSNFFDHAAAERPPITLILSLETMTYEAAFAAADFPGRDVSAQLLETLGLYEALTRLGPPPAIKHFDDYPWEASSERPRTAVLPDIRTLTEAQITRLKAFVANRNTLLVTGLTGLFDPHGKAWPLAAFPLSAVTGGKLKEVSFIGNIFSLALTSPSAELPSHLWTGTVDSTAGRIIASRDGEVTATDWQRPGNGRVIWIPSPIGLGAWLQNSAPLAKYLRTTLSGVYDGMPFRFRESEHSCVLRVLRTGDSYLTVVTNGAAMPTNCSLEGKGRKPELLWGEAPETGHGETMFRLGPKATTVLLWK
jgi:beta-galactosidase